MRFLKEIKAYRRLKVAVVRSQIVTLSILMAFLFSVPMVGIASPTDDPTVTPNLACDEKLKPQVDVAALILTIWKEKIDQLHENILKQEPEYRWRQPEPEYVYQDKYTDLEWQAVARDVFRLLGDRQFMADFARDFLNEALSETLKGEKPSQFLLWGFDLEVAKKIWLRRANAHGWREIIWIDGDKEKIFYEMLAAGYLFRDLGFSSVGKQESKHLHGADGHLMQILAVAPEIDHLYGPKTMYGFIRYIGESHKGRDIWLRIFDLGPQYYYNFHSPTAFYDFPWMDSFHDARNPRRLPEEPIFKSERRGRSRR